MIQDETTIQTPSKSTKAGKSNGNGRKAWLTLGLTALSAGNIWLSTMPNPDAVSTYSDENAPKRPTLVQNDNALTVGLKDAEHLKDSFQYTVEANKAVISDNTRRVFNVATGAAAGIPALALFVDLGKFRSRREKKLKTAPAQKI